MKTVGAFDAKTHLSALLDRVAKGEKIAITRHGVPVAVLTPPEESVPRERQRAIEKLLELGKRQSLKGIPLRELIETGRRF